MRLGDAPRMVSVDTYDHFAVKHARAEEWVEEAVAQEVPVALEYNGVSHAVMFASPADLEDFGLGFSLTEGIIESRQELFELDTRTEAAGITVDMRIAGDRFMALKERRRTLTGRTGCGLCGTESLDQAVRPLSPVTSRIQLASTAMHQAFEALRERQRLMSLTGAVHAAGWVNADGRLTLVREDIGRHNALDKLIGALADSGIDFATGAAIITSRASFEMVHKAASMNIGLLAAVSAPTALAIRMAETAGLTLIGFVRGKQYAIYSHGERLREETTEYVAQMESTQ